MEQTAHLEQICFAVPWSLELLEQGLVNPLDSFRVLEVSDIGELASGEAGSERHIIGYACLRVIAAEGEILRIAVHPGFRGRGYGKKLMDAMVVFAKHEKVSEITLEVRASNQAAINLYKSYGFREEATRKAYYEWPTEDAVLMWNRNV